MRSHDAIRPPVPEGEPGETDAMVRFVLLRRTKILGLEERASAAGGSSAGDWEEYRIMTRFLVRNAQAKYHGEKLDK